MTIGERGFKKKTICNVIEEKAEEWLATLPKELAEKARNDYILTGGAIASMLMGELPNDFDFYFQTPEVVKEIADYYINQIHVKNYRIGDIASFIEGDRVRIKVKSAGAAFGEEDQAEYEYLESCSPEEISKYFNNKKFIKQKDKPTYKCHYMTANCISLDGDVQLVIRFIGDPESIHKTYDYIHATNYYSKKTGLVLKQEALESILAKELKYIGSLYPVCSLFRMRKFIQRGWTITAGEMFKIAYDISKLNLNDFRVLEDQLIGVDTAYFSEVLSILSKNTDKQLDRTYLFELINRVFEENV